MNIQWGSSLQEVNPLPSWSSFVPTSCFSLFAASSWNLVKSNLFLFKGGIGIWFWSNSLGKKKPSFIWKDSSELSNHSFFFYQIFTNLRLLSTAMDISESHSVVSDSLQPWGPYSPWNSPGQNTGVGSHSFLQGIFPAQGLNPGLLYCRQILYHLSHQENSGRLEWVAYPFSSRSSYPGIGTGVSCFAGGFFTSWATRDALKVMDIRDVKMNTAWSLPLLSLMGKWDT